MAWHRSIPAVLLLSLAVPVAGAKSAGPASAATPAISRIRNDGVSQKSDKANQTRLKRRGEDAEHDRLSDETISQAGEYLRCCANSLIPSDEARIEWERFYQHCDATIRRFASTFRGRGVDVDDCTQEVWTDLIGNLPDFKMDATRGQFNSWLYTIVRSKATDILRRQGRRTMTELSPAVMARAVATDVGPSELLDRQSDRESLHKAMAKLQEIASDSSYRVLHLRYIDGWNVQQVADALGFSREQVWVREHRMKRKLRDLLSPEFETPGTVNDSSIASGRKTA